MMARKAGSSVSRQLGVVLPVLCACLGVLLAAGCQDYDERIPGDLNGDGRVDGLDITALQAILDQGGANPAGDLNGDGLVDLEDLEVLKGLICRALGGTYGQDGACCTTAQDGTVCCDAELDGTFGDCTPPDQTCVENADCAALDCQAVCGSDHRCHCLDMCAEDEDCQVLNCPAYCNLDGHCECKVPCDGDEDCLPIQHCPSVCDAAAGHCVCGPSCLGAGEQAVNLLPSETPCCDGLAAREYTPYDPAGGGCITYDALVTVCVDCGDGVCGAGEDPCICVEDCGECVPGDLRDYTCADGGQVPWCTCGADARWACIDSPEVACASDCHGFAEHFTDFEGDQRCCQGLAKLTDTWPTLYGGEVVCDAYDCLCFVCLPCGDGVCGPEENFCNCEADCERPECLPGETMKCACQNFLAEEPDCYSCGADGKWYDILYAQDPCLCYASPAGCAAGFVCRTEDGRCAPDCRLTPCAAGEECDAHTGLCVEPGCLGEGEQFEDPTPEGRCCAGLTAVTYTFPDETTGEGCVGVNCPCFVCTRCGDGQCGPGENRCNCAADCVGASGCQAAECMQVDHAFWLSGDCLDGVAPPELPVPVTQVGCSLSFEQIMADVLGAGGCIDHDLIFTESGCSGSAHRMMASVTMYFTCPRDDGTTCGLYLDDGID